MTNQNPPNATERPIDRRARTLLVLAALAALLGVAFGAFGAHGLKGRLGETELAIYRTAVDYHLWHALGLGLIGLLVDRFPGSPYLHRAGWVMFAGILIFSGSLYALSLTGLRWLGMITPVGGVCFMIAWGLMAWGMHRNPARSDPTAPGR